MTRRQLLEILRAIQSRPQNRHRDIMAMAATCTGPGDLFAYMVARWRELPPEEMQTVTRITACIMANRSGFSTVAAAA